MYKTSGYGHYYKNNTTCRIIHFLTQIIQLYFLEHSCIYDPHKLYFISKDKWIPHSDHLGYGIMFPHTFLIIILWLLTLCVEKKDLNMN